MRRKEGRLEIQKEGGKGRGKGEGGRQKEREEI